MRWILALLLAGAAASGQPSVVNFTVTDSNSSTNTTWTSYWGQSCTENNVCTPGTGVATTSGHSLVCALAVQTGSDSGTSITDSAGQTEGAGIHNWQRMQSINATFNGHYYTTYYIPQSASLTSVTVNTVASPIVILCEEINAVLTFNLSAANDNGHYAGACSACAWATGTTSSSNSNEFWWANCGQTTSDFFTPSFPSGWTPGQLTPDDSNGWDAWKVAIGGGAASAASTYATSPNPGEGGELGSNTLCTVEAFTYTGAPTQGGSSVSGGVKFGGAAKIQ